VIELKYMYLLYLFCLIPVLIGFLLSLFNDKIAIKEWLIASGVAFLLAVPIHCHSYRSQVGDYETWSGKIVSAKYYSAWQEYYEEAIYKTEVYYTGSGKDRTRHTRQVFSHWSSRRRWHGEYFICYSNINTNYHISKEQYLYFVNKFDNQITVNGYRRTSKHNSRMIAGDPNDYETHLNNSSFVEPITIVKYYENRVKATPSVFNFVKVPKEVPVFEYPENKNNWISDRVLGTASNVINIRLWDEMNARLGPSKRLNVIIIGFDSSDSFLAEQQRAKWIGGKKNDLVLCYGQGWAKVFGWSESDICKRNIETILLKNTINNNIIPLVEKEIYENYKKREFTEDFAYLSVEPSGNHWLTFIVLMVLVQSGLYITFHFHDVGDTSIRCIVRKVN